MTMTGTGTSSDPFLITNPQELDMIRDNITAFYKLNNDIDMSSFGNFPTIPTFSGTINGNGKKIKNLYKMVGNEPTEGFIGRATSGARINDLALENIEYVNAPNHTTVSYLGGLVGTLDGRIQKCSITGTINCDNFSYIGGLVGYNLSTSSVLDCYIEVTITNDTKMTIGGMFGYFNGNCEIKRCVGNSTVLNAGKSYLCYGNFTGTGFANISNIYYNTSKTGASNASSTRLVARTDAQMKTQSTFATFNFTNVWSIKPNEYPQLQVFIPKATIATVEVKSSMESLVSSQRLFKRVLTRPLTFTQPIAQNVTGIKHRVRTVASALLDEIFSYAIATKNANTKIYSIISTLQELTGYSTRRAKKNTSIDSHIDSMTSHVDVEIVTAVEKPVYATTFYITDQSLLSMIHRVSEIENLIDRSIADSLTGESVIYTVKNQTETSVI